MLFKFKFKLQLEQGIKSHRTCMVRGGASGRASPALGTARWALDSSRLALRLAAAAAAAGISLWLAA